MEEYGIDTRENMESEILCKIIQSPKFLDAFYHDWYAIFKQVMDFGWKDVPDIYIALVYKWAQDWEEV